LPAKRTANPGFDIRIVDHRVCERRIEDTIDQAIGASSPTFR
jgi:hypothetical protein